MSGQVKSKERVAEHGEVFTAQREVNAMCDLVADECLRIDSRFLEPACGEGNFLAEILKRKLSSVKAKYKKSVYDMERYSILALTSIYGVDILADNAAICRNRLYDIWNEWYCDSCKGECSKAARSAARYVLDANIVCGNALSMMQVDEEQKDTDSPIVFTEWTFPLNDSRLQRRDFRLDVLMKDNPDDSNYEEQYDLLATDSTNNELWDVDPETRKQIPKPIKEYPLTDYRRLGEQE